MPRTNANAITTTKVLNITFRERELGQSRILQILRGICEKTGKILGEPISESNHS